MSAAIKLYRPSNGTEGESFIEDMCGNCERDRAFREDPDRNDGCPILAASYAFNIDDPRYPQEWQYVWFGGDECPTCTAFVESGKPIPPPRDELTPDMFA